ncbi:MAG: PHP domain-containing protein [Chloroflexi bacterium]|nr:PHP domain-containing protein [Chloroflexota bacterium]
MASDGHCRPAELIALVHKRQLNVIAITDHDTTAGLAEAQAARIDLRAACQLIPGIELSAALAGASVHVLGYFINPDDAAFQAALAALREQRVQRGRLMVQKLNDLGVPLDWATVQARAQGDVIGRAHLAGALYQGGYVDSLFEAFERYLGDDGPAYVPTPDLLPEDAIAMIHRAGGAAVLAHPAELSDYRTVIERLVPAGLDGLELVHPANHGQVRLDLRGLARQHDLVLTGGSDFHGPPEGSSDGRALPGAFTLPPGCVTALRARAARYANPG